MFSFLRPFRTAFKRQRTLGDSPRSMQQHRARGGVVAALTAIATTITSAPIEAKPYRPLVFLPGILGSVLADGNRVVWGERDSLNNFVELRLDAERPEADRLKPIGPIRSIRVLGPWKIHQYDSLLDTLGKAGFVEGKDLFIFAYDWRRSNFDNAKLLADWVEANPSLRNGFDILTHSMGGLVALVYIHNHGGMRRVARFIRMALPHRGSANSIATMAEGWGTLPNMLAGGMTTIRDVMLSFPSLYELLPQYDGCCAIGVPGGLRKPLDVTATALWFDQGLLPERYRVGPWRDMVTRSLTRARELNALAIKPLPGGIESIAFAGDLIATKSQVYFNPDTPRDWDKLQWRTADGDGTVLVLSAADGNITAARPAFINHQTIFTDENVRISLLRIFNDAYQDLPPLAGLDRPIVGTGVERAKIQKVTIVVDPPLLPTGAPVKVSFSLDLTRPIGRGIVIPKAQIISAEGRSAPVNLAEETTEEERNLGRLVFRATPFAPTTAGGNTLRISLPEVGDIEDYFETIRLR